MSTKQVHALMILRDHGPLTPREFARLMWPPDTPGWSQPQRCGPHAGGMSLAAGALLARLLKAGLCQPAYWTYQRELTDAGRQALQAQAEEAA